MGFERGGGQIFGFSIDLHRRPYNTLALPCECDGDILYRSQDIATYWYKIGNFYTPPVFSVPAGGDPIGIL